METKGDPGSKSISVENIEEKMKKLEEAKEQGKPVQTVYLEYWTFDIVLN